MKVGKLFRFRVRGKVKAQVQVRFEILLWLYSGEHLAETNVL